jgi:hypothetical protein
VTDQERIDRLKREVYRLRFRLRAVQQYYAITSHFIDARIREGYGEPRRPRAK